MNTKHLLLTLVLFGAACSDSSSPPADAGEADAAADGSSDGGSSDLCVPVGEPCSGRRCCGEMKCFIRKDMPDGTCR